MHFTCMVFDTENNDVYEMMEKFRENNFGDVDEQYLEWYGGITNEYYDSKEEAIKDGNEDEVWQVNPYSQFDWAVEGGRWNNFFAHKNGKRCTRIKIKDIDFAKMVSDIIDKQSKIWDEVNTVIDGDWNFKTMKEVLKDYETFEERKAFVDSQIQMKKLEEFYKEKDAYTAYMMFQNLDDMKEGRTKYLKRFEDVCRTYAFLYDGVWSEVDGNEWNQDGKYETFTDYLRSLPDDMEVTLMDCHV